MAGSAFKRLVVQTSHYSLTSLFVMVAGLVTFPLLTRLFSVADYGIMSLVGATISVAVALGKVGVQHSIIRYHSEIVAGHSRYSLAQLSSTTMLAMLATGGTAAFMLAIGSQLLPARWLGDPRIPGLTVIVSVVVAVQVFESTLIQFIRAEQRTSMLLIYQVAKKYVGVGLILFAVLVIARTLTAFYTATAIAESLTISALALFMFRRSGFLLPSPAQFSRPLYFELLGFGIPMLIGYELSGIILSVGARYVIAGTIGEDVGLLWLVWRAPNGATSEEALPILDGPRMRGAARGASSSWSSGRKSWAGCPTGSRRRSSPPASPRTKSRTPSARAASSRAMPAPRGSDASCGAARYAARPIRSAG